MIQDILRDPRAAAEFAQDPEDAFKRYGISVEEAALLESRTVEGMGQLGIHPNLQMKYLRLRRRQPPAGQFTPGPLDAYLDRLLEN